ncbi:hypothetical protein, partial [Shewanella xiamenensis]|uniref:hypothetical protein n=1 Tax=Shewanella xiamenensis TaxID=332186 RepID=UPI00313B2E36
MSFSDYIVAHCEADLKWMGPFHYPCLAHATNANALRQLRGEVYSASSASAVNPKRVMPVRFFVISLISSKITDFHLPLPRKLRRRPVCVTRYSFNKESSTPFSNFAGEGELLQLFVLFASHAKQTE